MINSSRYSVFTALIPYCLKYIYCTVLILILVVLSRVPVTVHTSHSKHTHFTFMQNACFTLNSTRQTCSFFFSSRVKVLRICLRLQLCLEKIGSQLAVNLLPSLITLRISIYNNRLKYKNEILESLKLFKDSFGFPHLQSNVCQKSAK